MSSPATYSETTAVFVLITKEKRFVSLVELTGARQWVYAFTALNKAKDFVRMMGRVSGFPTVDRVLPCTLGEWFAWQPKKKLPDLTIDADPQAIASYPLRLAADADKFDVQCVTRDLPTGTVHHVTITSKKQGAGGTP